MGLNIEMLRKKQQEIKKAAGQGGDNLFLYSNKLGEAEDIRILEPRDNTNGSYFVYQEGWWIDGKFFVTGASIGGADVIEDEVDRAKNSKDKDLIALVNAKNTNSAPKLKKETRYLVPILHLDCEFDKQDMLVDFTVKDDMGKVLVAKPTLLSAINNIVTARQYQNGTENGIADRVKGWNLTIGRSGKGMDTTYSAIGWTAQMEMDEKYYGDKVPDVYEISKKAMKSDEYLRSVIRNYLYGEDIIEDDSATETEGGKTEAKTADKAAPSRAGRGSKQAEKEEKEEPKKAGRGRSLIDDAEAALNDID